MKEYKEDNFSLEEIKEGILEGKSIIYPTDTVYGLAVSIEREEYLKKIYFIKERDFNMPLIALVDNFDKIEKIAKVTLFNKNIIERLTKKFWPGALTIVLEKKDNISDIMSAGKNTIGIRMPNHKLALDIIQSIGGILPTTSANISGEPSPSSYEELSEKIKNKVDIIVNGGAAPIAIPSTIIEISRENNIKILRKGSISMEDIEKALGKN